MKTSQRKTIIDKLLTDGFVSRNWALKNFISRLGAIICSLKKDKWELKGEWDNGDYYYKVIGSPYKKIIYRVPELGKELTLFK